LLPVNFLQQLPHELFGAGDHVGVYVGYHIGGTVPFGQHAISPVADQ
jgi:hypothetical protein